jgi:hypothetical protein
MRGRIRYERLVAGKRMKYAHNILVRKPKRRHQLEDRSVGERILLKWTFKMLNVREGVARFH